MYNNMIAITDETKVWTADHDIVMPIDIRDISRATEWVHWNGFKKGHTAFDFAAYVRETTAGQISCVLGLPEQTPIRSIADGVVIQISGGLAGNNAPYAKFINVEHGSEGSGLMSAYHHVVPIVETGAHVTKGQQIATLYKDPEGDVGRLVHLHFEMRNAWGSWSEGNTQGNRTVSPETVFPQLRKNLAMPQGTAHFQVLGPHDVTEYSIAHFRHLNVGK